MHGEQSNIVTQEQVAWFYCLILTGLEKMSTNIMTSETPAPVYSKYPKSKFDEMGPRI